MIMSRCSVCGEDLDRYTLETLTSLFRISGGYYTHKCKNCETTFAPPTFVLLVVVLALGHIDIRGANIDLVSGVLLIVSVFVVSIAYLVPLSVVKKTGDNQEQ